MSWRQQPWKERIRQNHSHMMMTMTMRRMLPWSDTEILSSSSSMPRSTPYRTQAQLFILAGPIVFARETFDVVILRKIFRKDFCVVERMNWMVEDVASRILFFWRNSGSPEPLICLSLSLCLSPTDALQVELRRIWAMQRPDLNRLQ